MKELNKHGDKRGIGGVGKGPQTYKWEVYRHGEFEASYKTMWAAGAHIGKSAHYVWQMAHGKTGKPMYYKNTPHIDNNGYEVRKSIR